MKDSRAESLIARETISCNSAEVNVHCAASNDKPLNEMGIESKLISGGGTRATDLGITLTASFGSELVVGDGGGDVWTPTSNNVLDRCGRVRIGE